MDNKTRNIKNLKRIAKYGLVFVIAFTLGKAAGSVPPTEYVYKDKIVTANSQECKDVINVDNRAFILLGEAMEQQTMPSIQAANTYLTDNQPTRTANAVSCLNN